MYAPLFSKLRVVTLLTLAGFFHPWQASRSQHACRFRPSNPERLNKQLNKKKDAEPLNPSNVAVKSD